MKSAKTTLKFEQILKWMMVEVLFGRAHYAITRSFGRKDRPEVLEAMSLTRDAHADCAQICAAKIFDRASDASFYTLLSAALKEAGTFKHGTASDVRKAARDANSRAAGLQATVDALLLRRNQTQAHIDARPILDPEQYVRMGRVSYRELDTSFKEVGSILNGFSQLYFGKQVSFDESVSRYFQRYEQTLDKVAEAIRKG